jgi:hypothetical protein
MEEAFLFQNEDVSVTEHVARFGGISYQVSNIGSVAVSYERKLSGFAIFLFLAGLVGIFVAYLMYQEPRISGYTVYAAGGGVACVIFSMLWQHLWPVYEYRFVMKTSSGDMHTINSRDRERVFKLKAAFEEAFARRGLMNQQ